MSNNYYYILNNYGKITRSEKEGDEIFNRTVLTKKKYFDGIFEERGRNEDEMKE